MGKRQGRPAGLTQRLDATSVLQHIIIVYVVGENKIGAINDA
jgi:hypothetical protein